MHGIQPYADMRLEINNYDIHYVRTQQKKDANHILIPQVICYVISVPKLLSFWYRYEKTDHLWNQNMICVFFLLWHMCVIGENTITILFARNALPIGHVHCFMYMYALDYTR